MSGCRRKELGLEEGVTQPELQLSCNTCPMPTATNHSGWSTVQPLSDDQCWTCPVNLRDKLTRRKKPVMGGFYVGGTDYPGRSWGWGQH